MSFEQIEKLQLFCHLEFTSSKIVSEMPTRRKILYNRHTTVIIDPTNQNQLQ